MHVTLKNFLFVFTYVFVQKLKGNAVQANYRETGTKDFVSDQVLAQLQNCRG